MKPGVFLLIKQIKIYFNNICKLSLCKRTIVPPERIMHLSRPLMPLSCCTIKSLLSLFLKVFTFREGRREGERKGEKHWCVRETSIGCLLHTPNRGLCHNQGLVPDQESNQRPSAVWDDARPTEPSRPGQIPPFSAPPSVSSCA